MLPRLALIVTVLLCLAPTASAATTSFKRMQGYNEPATPSKYDKVGVLKIGKKSAKNVLVLNPGTSASAAYFAPLARTIVRAEPDWQVWAVERRENLLEDHSAANQVKTGDAGAERLFDYYLGYLTDHSV